MGIHAVLQGIAPVASTVLAGVTAPSHPSEVGAGLDLRPWRERYRPEVVAMLGAVLESAWLIARVDGTIDHAERKALSEIVLSLASGGLRAQDVDDLLSESAATLLAEGLAARCAAVGEALARTGSAEAGLRVAVAVAGASNGVCIAESVTANAIANAAGIDQERADEILRETLAALAAAD